MRNNNRTTVLVFMILLYMCGYSQFDVNSVVSPNFIFETLALNKDIPTAAWPKYSSPADIVPSPDKSKIYIAEQTAKTIAVVDAATKAVEKKIQLPNEVTGIAVSPDGSRVYATCSSDWWPEGHVAEVDIASGKVIKRIAVGHGARSPNISPDGNTLYVNNMFDNNISVVDLVSKRVKDSIQVIREPYSSRITPDGKTLVVANSLPHGRSLDSLTITNKIQLINTADGTITAALPLPLGSHSAFGVGITPDSKYALVTHLLGMFNHEATRVTGGWLHTNNIAIIDIEAKILVNDIPLDYPESGAGNPWGITVSEDGKYVTIVTAGSNEIYVINLPQLIETAKNSSNLSANLTALNNVEHKRMAIDAKSPRSVITLGDKIYTAGFFSDTLLAFNLTTNSSAADRRPQARVQLQASPNPLTRHRLGEYRFIDASLCQQSWQSCNSCHPFARPDALNWLLNQSNKMPKNAKSMVYSWWTPKTGWAQKRDDARSSVRFGIDEELFVDVVDDVLASDIDSFLVRLKPVPSPYLVKGRLSESAKRGQAIYFNLSKANCVYCHPRPLYTDQQTHDAGFVDPFDINKDWDTPALHESWRTAPYDHVGGTATMEECLKSPNHAKLIKPDGTPTITESEFKDLVEFVLSL